MKLCEWSVFTSDSVNIKNTAIIIFSHHIKVDRCLFFFVIRTQKVNIVQYQLGRIKKWKIV